MGCSAQIERERSHIICERRKSAGYAFRMGNSVSAIDAFPDDELLWRIEWIGGVGYNTSVPSEPQIDICLAQLPLGEVSPLSARSRCSQTKRTVKIGVGLLPYISITSVWQKRRSVVMDLTAYRHRLRIDTTSGRMVALDELTSSHNAIPRRAYLFGPSWPHVRRTRLVATEQHGDPCAVMVPTAEIIRFYYGTIEGVFLRLPGPTPDHPRWLVLRIERCSAPFPFDRVIVGRDNNGTHGQNVEDETLRSAWAKTAKTEESEREARTQAPDTFRSNKEPQRGLEPLRIDLVEDRFEYLRGKMLVKEEKAVQRYRHVPMEPAANQMLNGLGTGQGTWGASNLLLTKLTTVQSGFAGQHGDICASN